MNIPVTTTFNIDGYRIINYLGIVRGIVVRAPTISQGILGGLKSIVGGKIGAYTEMCEQARQQAYEVLIQHAVAVGANAVVGLRYDASGIIAGGPNPQNAALVLDFLNSKEAHEIVAGTNRRSVRVDVPALAGLAPTDQIKTFPYDAALAAKNRDENIKHWDELFSR